MRFEDRVLAYQKRTKGKYDRCNPITGVSAGALEGLLLIVGYVFVLAYRAWVRIGKALPHEGVVYRIVGLVSFYFLIAGQTLQYMMLPLMLFGYTMWTTGQRGTRLRKHISPLFSANLERACG